MTAVAGCHTHYRGSHLIQTISVQFHWESVRTVGLIETAILRWPANSGGH